MSKGKVLVVDDQYGIRCLLEELLGESGYEVFLAENGYEALDLIKEKAPELVLMDMKMPGMDGIDTLIELKELGLPCKVIMMTAYGELESVQQARSLGAYGYIAKPFDIHKLSALVDAFVSGVELPQEV